MKSSGRRRVCSLIGPASSDGAAAVQSPARGEIRNLIVPDRLASISRGALAVEDRACGREDQAVDPVARLDGGAAVARLESCDMIAGR